MNLAHRGASEYAPENTMAAFYKGIELGANGIETDLKVTKDGVIILFHDENLKRTTNIEGLVSDYTWDELKHIDSGSWFSDKYLGEKLVTLDNFLYFFGNKPLIFALEIKDDFIEEDILQIIYNYNIIQKTTITSFSYEHLRKVRSLNKEINIGYLTKKIDNNIINKVLSINGKQICPFVQHLSKDDVMLAKRYGMQVRAWGIKNEELMMHAIECGVDGMTVNFPEKLNKIINGKHFNVNSQI